MKEPFFASSVIKQKIRTMSIRAAKYLFIFTVPMVGFMGFFVNGPWTWAVPVYAFVLVPLVELLMRPDAVNMSKAEEEMVRQDRIYDILVYLTVPLQWSMFITFMMVMSTATLQPYEYVGLVLSMGIGCGALGINVAHELGHRHKWYEQWMSKALLLTAQYMHFFIEHNRGHHKRVSTNEDPATSRYGEVVYTFWFRSIVMGYLSAWEIETARLAKLGRPWWHWSNEMLFYAACQLGFLAIVHYFYGSMVTVSVFAASFLGILLLETVNYIEHYGLQRHATASGYQRVQPIHSWNSNHVFGRLLLFELSRHSDHHYMASRPYQVLRHFDDSPQMPTGYPGMIMLSLCPPLWFAVMNPRVRQLQQKYPDDLVGAVA